MWSILRNMRFENNDFDKSGSAARVWLFSGFTGDGEKFAHEFSGPESDGRSFPFKETCLIGRDPDRCAFFIADPTVSRIHAELRYFPGQGVGICDLNSGNGTFVNERRIGSEGHEILEIGSEIRVGSINITVSYPR